MGKRKCEDCGKEMEMWYMMEGYEEWFCDKCQTYKEYKDDELVKELNLEGVEDIDV